LVGRGLGWASAIALLVTPAVHAAPAAAQNGAPVCQDFRLPAVQKNFSNSATVPCEDPDGDPLTFSVVAPPAHGVVSFYHSAFTYRAERGYVGADSFELAASDGTATSAPATVSVVVSNTLPVCYDEEPLLGPDDPVAIDLPCDLDMDGDQLTYTIVDLPAHGAVGPIDEDGTVVYDPDDGYLGPDRLTFRSNDGTDDSSLATLDITVRPNRGPACAELRTSQIPVGGPDDFTIGCWDLDDEPETLTWTIADEPDHGTAEVPLHARGYPDLRYVPAPGFTGADHVTVEVSDGLRSARTTKRIHVADTPFCSPLPPVPVRSGRGRTLELDCTRPSGDEQLAIVVDAPPSKGTLTPGSWDAATYRAAGDAVGEDAFTFHAVSEHGDSPPVVQPIVTGPGAGYPPSCSEPERPWVAYAGRPLPLYAAFCYDRDQDPFTFAAAGQPAHGTLDDTGGTLVYTPLPGYVGPDTIRFVATDEHGMATAVIEHPVDVRPGDPQPNRPPACVPQDDEPQAVAQEPVALHPVCSDPDGDALGYAVVAGPAHGTVALANGLVYTPDSEYAGPDELSFVAVDVHGARSEPAVWRLDVLPPPESSCAARGDCPDREGEAGSPSVASGSGGDAPSGLTGRPEGKVAEAPAIAALRGQRLRTVLARGLAVRLSFTAGRHVSARLQIDRRTGRRTGLRGHQVVGRASWTGAAAPVVHHIPLSRAARRALRGHGRPVRFRLTLRVRDPDGAVHVLRRTVRLGSRS
jgi:hypothetical protein